eukprot:GEMP01024143.1.p1 GENE.GEMP01024143.1~~GEMP01024143.1.p1  ORF type:complete len:166 (+),score=13.23 GEMP01024143.1:130-627(+)
MGDDWAEREVQCLTDQCNALRSLLSVKDVEVATKLKLMDAQNQCLEAARAHMMHLERQLKNIESSTGGSPLHQIASSSPSRNPPTYWGTTGPRNGYPNPRHYVGQATDAMESNYSNESHLRYTSGADHWRGIPTHASGYDSMKGYYSPYPPNSYHQYGSEYHSSI